MAAARIEEDAVLVITDKEYGVLLSGGSARISERAVILTVRDDATMEQRLAMAQRAAEIVAARSRP